MSQWVRNSGTAQLGQLLRVSAGYAKNAVQCSTGRVTSGMHGGEKAVRDLPGYFGVETKYTGLQACTPPARPQAEGFSPAPPTRALVEVFGAGISLYQHDKAKETPRYYWQKRSTCWVFRADPVSKSGCLGIIRLAAAMDGRRLQPWTMGGRWLWRERITPAQACCWRTR